MMLLLKCLVAVGLAGLGAELLARLWVRRSPYRVLAPGRIDRLSLDMATLPTLDPHIVHRVNAHGERGSERPTDPAAFRVLAAGGSAVSCYMLDEAVAWPGALERKLQAHPFFADRPVHVGNIGKSSVDSAALEMILTKVLPQEPRLDVLVIMVGASDILRWLEIDAPADRGALVLETDECFERRPDVAFGWTPKRLALATLYRWRREAQGKLRTNSGRRYGVARKMRAEAAVTRNEVPDTAHVTARFETNLRRTIQFAQRHVSHVVVARQPWFRKDAYLPDELALFWSGSVGDAYSTRCDTFYSPEALSEMMRRIDASAEAVAEALGVPSVNVGSVLESSVRMYMDQFHFTPPGSDVVAGAIADEVLGVLVGDTTVELRDEASAA